MSSSPSTPAGMSAADSDAPRTVSSFLLSHGLDVRRESVRVVVGFALLLVAGVVALNMTLWRNASHRIEANAWRRLESAADVQRKDVDQTLGVLRREALSVLRSPQVVAAVTSWSRTRPSPGTLADLTDRAEQFEFHNLVVLDEHGEVLGEWHPRPTGQQAFDRSAAEIATRVGVPVWTSPREGVVGLAVPVASAGRAPRTVVFHTSFEQALAPLLQQWPGFSGTAGAYLVQADGDHAEVLSAPPGSHGPSVGTRLPMAQRSAMAPAMAATGVASRVEDLKASGGATWSVTRSLEHAPWGLVAQADRGELMNGMTTVRQALLLLDAVLIAVFFAIGLVWHRSYRRGLARREIEITERHARRLQAILDTAFDAIVTFDRVGRVRTLNRAAEAMIRRPASELVDHPIQKFLSWGTTGRAVSLPQVGSVVAGEALRSDGEKIPVEFSLARSGEGEDLVFTAIVRDVRERVEAEQRIRAFAEGLEQSNRRLEEVNAQLEEASRLKSEFLANTSHELRTPLNGMIGFLQLVLDGMCDSREEETEFLQQALQCSRHLLGLINDVLDIAKIEAGKLALDFGRLDVQALFDEVQTVTHVQAAQKGLRLVFEDQTEGDVAARGDAGKVKQILINLVGNSLKFTSKGEIRVRAKAHPQLGHVMIEVEDTGIGVAKSRQKVVFDKFVQADGSTTRRFGGTGLGLSISKSLVELMGGIIGIHSEGEGRGTRVYFSLPIWREQDEAPVSLVEGGSDRIEGSAGDPLVLVVEDDAVFRRFLTAVLQHGGYRTVEADHAEAAWVLVRRLRPAVVVLDYALACQEGAALRTGWDLAQRMTSEAETRHTPVVFVTGFDGELKQRLHATAFARRPAHLVKPVEPKTLIGKISELAGSPGNRVTRVLMADDDPTVSAYVRKVLTPDKFHVDVANNGEECLHILRTQPKGYDLLLLDLMMPEVSGYDVLREMTLSGLHPDLPVMVLTNFPEPRNEEERRLLEDGLVLDVISKTAVHDNPQVLPHMLDWHLQVSRGEEGGEEGFDDLDSEPERRAA